MLWKQITLDQLLLLKVSEKNSLLRGILICYLIFIVVARSELSKVKKKK